MAGLIILLLSSCNGLRKLEEGQYLLNKNTIKSDYREHHDEMMAILKQKPNRKILGIFRFHLGIYNLASQGKPTRFKNWVKNTIGEAPVILDSTLTNRSTEQLLIYMQNNGFFNATVQDSIKYVRHHKANVTYFIKSKQPYKIKSIHYNIKDERISSIVLADSANCLIKSGQNYNKNNFQGERERISKLLKNRGYYYFSPLFITYTADSSLLSNDVNVFLQIANPTSIENGEASTEHHTYSIKDIYIQTDYDPLSNKQVIPTDTVAYQGYYFITAHSQIANPKLLLQYVFINPDELYNLTDLEKTYKQIQDLNVFRFIIIKYELVPGTDSLNCFILLTPLSRHSYKLEAEGTNTGGNHGLAGNLSYQNKNTFKGAEQFEFKFKGGIEAQRELSDTTLNNSNRALFNVYEIGPEISLSVPRILFPFTKPIWFNSPQTNFVAGYNFQQRPEFKRTVANLSYSLNFKASDTKRHYFYPGDVNFVKVYLQESFRKQLEATNDPALISSYEDQMITDFRYVFVYNSQQLGKLKNHVYFKGTFESAGHFISLFNKIANNSKPEGEQLTVFNVPYAQYLRPDLDFRFYQIFSENSQLVYRFATGLGFAYGNSQLMPVEKSFFAGGSNDLRAWRTRSLGPGSYSNSESFEKYGDIKINGNIEYRFDIFRKLEGALFADAGNIWLLKEDIKRPGAQFKADEFIQQLALGTGLGLRLDFTFFILRFDWGIKLKDPTLPKEDQWVIKDKNTKNTILNFGIGYPF